VRLMRRNDYNRGGGMLKNVNSVLTGQKSSNSIIPSTMRLVFGRVLLAIGIVVFFSFEASAQFIVQPMQINVQARPGSLVRRVFKLENRNRLESHYVTIDVVELMQARNGSWAVFDPNMLTELNSGFNFETHSSCRDWLSLARNEADIPAYDSTTESLNIRIPSNAKGFSCAGLRVALAPRPGADGVVVKYDFIVPICISIEGRALRSDVSLQSSGLKFHEAEDGKRESTSVVVSIKNEGTTHSKLTPIASIWQVLPTSTRLVKRDVELPEMGIIPGAEIDIMTDLYSSLPTGTYKIVTRLSVDGRRVKGLTKEVDFDNPVFSGLAHQDAAMRLIPGQIDLELQPGRVGNQKIVIHNYSDEDIVVKAIPVVPDVLAHKFLDVRGEDISCAEWIEVRPNELPIRAGGERKVTVIVRMPKEDLLPVLTVDPTNYYGTVKFYGFYRDRSSAGMTSAMVNVMKRGALPTPVIQEKDLKIQSLGQSRFQLVGVFSNFGTIHVVPTCTGRIQSDGEQGSRIQYGTMTMANQDADKILMPFETREFSAEVDFSDIPAGRYIVTARIDFGRGVGMNKEIMKTFEVFDRDGEKLIFSVDESIRPVASSGG